MSLLFYLLFLFLFSRSSLATGEFTVKQDISYNLSNTGEAKVTQEINLTNNISQIYAKEYQVNLSDSDIHDLKGHDKSGNIIDSIQTTTNTTTALLKFSKPTIGKDQTNQFFLEYTIPGFAKKKGNTWEIQFPIFENQSDSQQINILLDIPDSYGELSFASTPILKTHTINHRTQIQFNQNQAKGKILLIFGNHQLFDFKLNFYINNNQSTKISTEIPLPPDTNNQTVVFQDISPLPNKIRSDQDGNWLAQYDLSPGQFINITATGQVKVHPPQPTESSLASTELTKPQKFWPTTDPQIIEISKLVNSPKQIYQYVVNTLSYNYDGISTATRQGAKEALLKPNNALCTEFTDLFVTLARANNIPAREIEGYAYSNNSKIKPLNTNSDILHAWPEYFDATKKTWVQIDPTWEKTTNGIDYFSDLDLNHVTFVIHGLSSTNPPPPGSYKKDKLTKSVFVDFATTYIETKYQPPILNIVENKLTVKNPNLYQLPEFSIKLDTLSWTQKVSRMPPLSTIELELPKIPFYYSILPKFERLTFTIINTDSPPAITNLIYKPHFLNLSITIGIIIFILCVGGIILTTSKKQDEKNI